MCGSDPPVVGGGLMNQKHSNQLQVPPVDKLIALVEPVEAGQPPAAGAAVQVHQHVLLRHQPLEGPDHVPAAREQEGDAGARRGAGGAAVTHKNKLSMT